MDDAGAVRGVERAANVDRKRQCLARIHGSPAAARQARGQGLPVEILQHEEVDAILMTDIEQRADVWMIERRDRARLALEALTQLPVPRERCGQDFDRYDTLEARIAGAIHLAHAAFAQGGENLVRSEPSAGAK